MNFIKNIFKAIKELFKKEELKSAAYLQKKEAFEKIKVGDVIWAKRYNTEEERKLIPEKHQEGPFIVVIKEGDELICAKGTSVEQTQFNKYYRIDMPKYNLQKHTYFKLFDLSKINLNTFIEKLDSMESNELNNFLKLIKQKNNKNEEITSKILLHAGEIIEYKNEKHVIIDIDNNKLTCVPLNKIIINSKTTIKSLRDVDYSKEIIIDNNNYKYLGLLKENLYMYVLKSYKEYLEYCKQQKITQRGSVVFKNNKYYYIYGEEGKNWIAFEITKEEKDYSININNDKYYTDFADVILDKKEDFNIVYLCKEEEIDNVKDIRKNYKEKEKQRIEQQATQNLRFNVGDIIESKYYKNKRFIIIKVCPKTYECLSIEKIKLGINDPVLIKKLDSKLSKNTSIEGIKWLEWNPTFKLSKIREERNLNKIFDTQKRWLEELRVANEQKKLEQPKRGTIISKNDNYHYIYGEEGQDWLTFKLEKEFYLNYDKLDINENLYYTNYDDMKINKKEIVDIVYYCTDPEIDNIKDKRKTYKRVAQSKQISNSVNEIDNSSNEIKIDSIIKCNEFSEEEFVVESIMGNILVCRSGLDGKYRRPEKHYFNKDNVIVVSNKQKRK